MRNIFSRDKLIAIRDWFKGEAPKGRVIPILALVFVIAISVAIGILYYQGRLSQIAELEYFEYYGYPAVFVVSMIWNSTVLVPIPSFPIYLPLATIFCRGSYWRANRLYGRLQWAGVSAKAQDVCPSRALGKEMGRYCYLWL